jgi:hypothetical protein
VSEAGHLLELLAEFVKLRQSGRSRDEAWLDIEEPVSKLSQRELSRLLTLLRGWEAKEGRNYKPSREDIYETRSTPPDGLKEQLQNMDSKSVIRRITPPNAQPPVRSSGHECPKCHKMNQSTDVYCYSCGTLLIAPGATQQIGDTQPVEGNQPDPAFFGPDMVLYVQVRGAKQMIRMQPRKEEMIIGRQSSESVMLPDIDLSPYQADTQGVSRLHAGLRRQDNTLVLSDLGSLNHTYINGQRLHQLEVRVLHDGDELRFGSLIVRIYFRNS